MLRRWDYETCNCGQHHQDTVITQDKVPQKHKCKCGRRVGWMLMKANHIHATTSALYGRYEPGLGQVVESYTHKKSLMKKYGVQESSDPVGGSRCHQKEEPAAHKPSNSTWMHDPDLQEAQKEAVRRASVGDFDLEM